MKNLKIIVLALIMLGILGGAVAYMMYNKPHKDVADAKPEKSFDAIDLYNTLKTKDSVGLAAYTGKIYEVTGTVSKIDAPNDSTRIVFLSIPGNSTDNISCSMDPKYLDRIKNFKVGQDRKIKGIFTGLNKFEDADFGISIIDVDLSRCVADTSIVLGTPAF